MNKEEKERARDLLEEARKIKDTNNQPIKGGRLDNGNSGEYTKLIRKKKCKLYSVKIVK